MKILYVTPPFTGAEKVILNKSNEFSGLPPFVKTIQGLRKRGHEIDFIVVGKKEEKNTYLADDDKILFSSWNPRGINKFLSVIKLAVKVKGKIKQGNYDFVYGHGSLGIVATIISRFYKIPTGQRLYGAYPLLKSFNKNVYKMKIMIKQPLYYFSFKLPKAFLIVTNDGTSGDIICKKINGNNKPKFTFRFWTNGVDKLTYSEPLEKITTDFILYPGRIDSQKQQINALKVVGKLKDKGCNIKFYFAGAADFAYADKVKAIVAEEKLEENVKFLGSVSREGMGYLYDKALATLLLYDISNKGNTSLEALKAGSVIITYNNAGLNELIVDKENGFLVETEDEAAEIIYKLANKEIDINLLKEKARQVADQKLESWEERVDKEIKLIERSIYRD